MNKSNNISEKLFTDINNPFIDIESDLSTLIKKCGFLTAELNEYKIKTESNTKKMLLAFIEVIDAFENVFENIRIKADSVDQQTKIWVGNFRTVYRLLLRSLKTAGVIPMETIIGDKADPYWHKVVEVIEDPDRDSETVVEIIRKGYFWNGKILREAEVKAVKNSV